MSSSYLDRCNIEGAFIHVKAEIIPLDLLDNPGIKNVVAKGVHNG